jgi:amino acid adenylation domain-containing protein
MNLYKPTISQKLIWLDQAISRTSAKYNIGGYACLEGNISYAFFNDAVRIILKSQEVYSSFFCESDGDLKCLLKNEGSDYFIQILDFSKDASPERSALTWMENDFSIAFEMENTCLFSFKLIKVNEQKHFWYAKIHHIISDGWSFKLLLNQTADIYSSFVFKKEYTFPAFRYSDYAVEDEAYYTSAMAENDKNYWISEYKDLPPELFQKMNTSQGSTRSMNSNTLYLPAETKRHLEHFAQENKVSLFQLIISLFVIYFCRTRQQDEVCIGIPVLNRTKKAYKCTSGVFMNLLPLKFHIKGDYKITAVLSSVKQKMHAALKHQRYQYGSLMKELKIPIRKQMYDIRISYEDFDFTNDFGGLKATAVALSNHFEDDKLAIYLRDYHEQGFDIRFVYNTGYFDRNMIKSIGDSLEQMASSVVQYEDLAINQIQLLSPEEINKIIQLSRGAVIERRDTTFLNMWYRSSSLYSEKIAVSTGKGRFSYKEIDLQAKKISIELTKQITGRNRNICLLLSRSEKMIAGILGSMMAGITYIPLDPSFPEERIKNILSDADCKLVLTSHEMRSILSNPDDINILEIDNLLNSPATVETIDIAGITGELSCYIIYTSGSTGTPKGVMISHKSLIDYVCTFREYFEVTDKDTVLQQAAISFDTSIEEIFPILGSGGRLHILEDRQDLSLFLETLTMENISILSTSPLILKLLHEYTLPSSLRLLISGGDILRPAYIKEFVQQEIPVYNTYGPTESTVCASYYRVRGNEDIIPVGKPITNREIYILDNHLQLQPLGVEGEICLGGVGLASGYINSTELTKEKFIDHFLAYGTKIYRTGDTGILMPDGNILFKGRNDIQLNYRGYRIEPYEVEKVVCREKNVKDCIVEVKEFGQSSFLVAYIKYSCDPHYSVNEWCRLLRHALPVYMIPDVWIELDEIPLLLNGKINRKALPALQPFMFQSDDKEKFISHSPTEIRIYEIWKDILQQENIGMEDSFFELGGHSLSIMQLANLYYRTFKVKLSVQELFEQVTIPSHAKLIAIKSVIEYNPIKRVKEAEDYAVSYGQRGMWVLSQQEERSRAYNLTGQLTLDGEYKAEHFEAALHKIIERHEILHTVFRENLAGELRQIILPAKKSLFKFVYKDFQGMQSDTVNIYLEEERTRLFNLSQGPLVRAGLIRSGTERYIFYYTMHHIISDGVSLEILVKEVLDSYRAYECGSSPDLSPLSIQYKDYAEWHREELLTEKYKIHRSYWLEQLSGVLPVLNLPSAKQRPSVATHNGFRISTIIRKEMVESLSDFCRQHQGTLFMGLVGVLKALFHRYTGQEDLIIGSPVMGREHAELENQVGLYINTLALRTRFNGSDSFLQLLEKIRELALSAYTHQGYPFNRLVEELELERDISRSAIFDVVVVLQNQQEKSFQMNMNALDGDQINDEGTCASKFDLVFDFTEKKEGLRFSVEFNTDIYDRGCISRLIGHYKRLLMVVMAHPDMSINQLDYLSAEEKTQLLGQFKTVPAVPTLEELDEVIDSLKWFAQDTGNDSFYKVEEFII